MEMITCDRATYDAAVVAHKKYEPFFNKSIDHYDEMTLVVGKDMATKSFAKTFADIDLDDGNQDLVPIICDNEETEEVNTKVSSSVTSKHKRKLKKVWLMNKLNFWVNNLAKLLILWNNLL
ncbi:GA-binding subunit beta-1 [Gossypium arboreum]|uniref:GA-binding subunit beta-1 n=1 Tax=Gossypium arboreum TaxID=29729 RepID=A0A0B0MXY6_GOSAR|nr:GA-binding subunit beta-1 [Gossypium arboreum]